MRPVWLLLAHEGPQLLVSSLSLSCKSRTLSSVSPPLLRGARTVKEETRRQPRFAPRSPVGRRFVTCEKAGRKAGHQGRQRSEESELLWLCSRARTPDFSGLEKKTSIVVRSHSLGVYSAWPTYELGQPIPLSLSLPSSPSKVCAIEATDSPHEKGNNSERVSVCM